jgi:hypothetical protein
MPKMQSTRAAVGGGAYYSLALSNTFQRFIHTTVLWDELAMRASCCKSVEWLVGHRRAIEMASLKRKRR